MTAPGIWCQTGSNRAVDLINPRPEMIDLKVDVAEGLARIARFSGQITSGPYSVAQHCVMGADALMRETGDTTLAAAFLLHDAHEAYIGDITSPAAAAIIAAAGQMAAIGYPTTLPAGDTAFAQTHSAPGPAASAYTKAGIALLKYRLDAAIFAAAGMPWPLRSNEQAAIKAMDLRMLATERRHLLGPSPYPWHSDVEKAQPIRLVGKFPLWPWPEAADVWLSRLRTWLPDACPRTANSARRRAA